MRLLELTSTPYTHRVEALKTPPGLSCTPAAITHYGARKKNKPCVNFNLAPQRLQSLARSQFRVGPCCLVGQVVINRPSAAAAAARVQLKCALNTCA